MTQAAKSSRGRHAAVERPAALDRLAAAVEHAAHLLPAQGPISVFIHHNTLHAFEDMPFADAVARGARVFGCQPYLSEERYRDELFRGRIRAADIEAAVAEDLGDRADELVAGLSPRRTVRLRMLQHPLRTGTSDELLWFVAETDSHRKIRDDVPADVRGRLISETRRWVMRDLYPSLNAEAASTLTHPPTAIPKTWMELFDRLGANRIEAWDEARWEAFTVQSLWKACWEGTARLPESGPANPPVRHRDLLLAATATDSDLLVHDILIPFCAAYLDQGVATWALPGRDGGFLQAFIEVHGHAGGRLEPWLRDLPRLLARVRDLKDPMASVHESLTALGVTEEDWGPYLSATFLALRGWGGMIRQVEQRGERVVRPIPAGSLVEFLAVRLILDRLALAHTARTVLGYEGPLAGLREVARAGRVGPAHSHDQITFVLFQIAQILGWPAFRLLELGQDGWIHLISEIEAFSAIERRRVFHQAFERRFYARTLDTLAAHRPDESMRAARPRFQAMFCIDEREESFRRHLEEIAPDCETLGVAGFFGVPMFFKGAADAHFTPLCPVVVQPRHYVCEEVDEGLEDDHRRRTEWRRTLGHAARRAHLGSRNLPIGAVASMSGIFAGICLVGRVLTPRLTAWVRRTVGRVVSVPPRTRLRLERKLADPGPAVGGQGFTIAEMADMGERLLRDIGMTSNFARLVLILGHGSTSLNNPHLSAYNCGACGGSAGGPNARTATCILNDSCVRRLLLERGLEIPEDTVFVAGWHNTCKDITTFFETDRLPDSHREDFARARRDLAEAGERNAHERCRRFLSAPLDQTPAAARLHVEGRSEDLSQARPECGHASNAVTIVGRRERTSGIFLDRRAFLNSYDARQDTPDGAALTRILQAVFPVCGGISLEYFFSYVDNPGYGCGSKLPHNITALLGVMDGARSDLRTGLPWQMVEIHEPMRPLFVLETKPEIVAGILARHPDLGTLVTNGWVEVAILDPDSNQIWRFGPDGYEPHQPESTEIPRAASSVDWYRGWRENMEFAEIGIGG